VYSTPIELRAELVKQLLAAFDIEAVVIPKQDRSYHNFGDFEVYVSRNVCLKAFKIIEDEFESE
jgi:hypothetical protein